MGVNLRWVNWYRRQYGSLSNMVLAYDLAIHDMSLSKELEAGPQNILIMFIATLFEATKRWGHLSVYPWITG